MQRAHSSHRLDDRGSRKREIEGQDGSSTAQTANPPGLKGLSYGTTTRRPCDSAPPRPIALTAHVADVTGKVTCAPPNT